MQNKPTERNCYLQNNKKSEKSFFFIIPLYLSLHFILYEQFTRVSGCISTYSG